MRNTYEGFVPPSTEVYELIGGMESIKNFQEHFHALNGTVYTSTQKH